MKQLRYKMFRINFFFLLLLLLLPLSVELNRLEDVSSILFSTFQISSQKKSILRWKKILEGHLSPFHPRVTPLCVCVRARTPVHLHARRRICCVYKSVIILCHHHESSHDIVPVRAKAASETENKLCCSHKF